MRWAAWCLVGLVGGCGKSHADDANPDQGKGATAGAGSMGVPESGGAGSTTSNGGSAGGAVTPRGGTGSGGAPTGGGSGSPSNGGSPGAGASTAGAPSVAGSSSGGTDSAGASGGQPASDGGALATAGSGNAGAAGAPEDECGAYVACGCGCCGGTDVSHACYYPDLGDTLAAVIARDKAQAMDEDCANAGCALGTEYACCVLPSEAGAATYRVDAYSAEIARLTLFRADPDDACTTLTLSAGHDVPLYPIEVPEGWKVDAGSNGFGCAEAYNFPSLRHAIGGEGHVEFSTPDRCAIDFDVTLFFYLGDGAEIQATRFVGTGVPVPNIGANCE